MSKRYARDKRPYNVRPVEKIELDESHVKRRVVLAVLFLVIGLAALSYGIISARTARPEWTEIEVDKSSDTNLGSDFTFWYYLGQAGVSATTERKSIIKLYSAQMVELYRLYTATKWVENVNNVYTLNQHPNETFDVDERLFKALRRTAEEGGRLLYYGPYYEYLNSLFFSEEDFNAESFDAMRDREAAAYFEELSGFIKDPEAISLEFPGENQVRLVVSEAYLSYAKDAGISTLIDLSPVQNAFAADEIAAYFRANGLTNGYFASDDGFMVNLKADETMTYSEYAFSEGKASVKNSWECEGAMSLVCFRSFPVKEDDLKRYYVYEDGTVVNTIINDDGLQAACFDTLAAYSGTGTCADLYFALYPFETGSYGKMSLSQIAASLKRREMTLLQ